MVPSSGKGIGTEVDAFEPGTVTNIFSDPGGAGGLIVYVQDSDGLTHAYMHLAGTQPGSVSWHSGAARHTYRDDG